MNTQNTSLYLVVVGLAWLCTWIVFLAAGDDEGGEVSP